MCNPGVEPALPLTLSSSCSGSWHMAFLQLLLNLATENQRECCELLRSYKCAPSFAGQFSTCWGNVSVLGGDGVSWLAAEVTTHVTERCAQVQAAWRPQAGYY